MAESTKRTIMITGASRGIGRAIAYAAAPHFDRMIITCKNSSDKLMDLQQELEKDYALECLTYVGDMGDYAFVESVFDGLDRIDALINNAGVSHVGLLSDMTADEWNCVINTNLNSVFYTSKFAIPMMLSRKEGRIINISSIWGNAGACMEVAYSASKGGVNSFTKALAKELAPSNIQVNALACGVIDTDMNRCFSEEERNMIINEIPADRMGTAREAAEAVMMLLNAPSYLTGQIVTMDGGYL